MSAKSSLAIAPESEPPISFSDRFFSSEKFHALFREGMDLVEQTADYLDEEGREDAKELKAPSSLAYATESMRLTTRLMQLASWLLIRRALADGEISMEEAEREKQKVKFDAIGRPGHVAGYDGLPTKLQSLIEKSFALYDRIAKIDDLLEGRLTLERTDEKARPEVSAQIARLEAAFAAHS